MSPSSADKLTVALSPQAEAQRQAATGPGQVEAFMALGATIRDIISAPEHCFEGKYVLGRDLKGVRRIKKGRARIFFIASREMGKAIVLMIGYRKEGDRKDAYAVLTKCMARGDFDDCFAELGLAPPKG